MYRRGDIIRDRGDSGPSFVILGSGIQINYTTNRLLTIRYLEDGHCPIVGRQMIKNATRVIPRVAVEYVAHTVAHDPKATSRDTSNRPPMPVEIECPECEEDMYFYIGDYICAYCREKLEEE